METVNTYLDYKLGQTFRTVYHANTIFLRYHMFLCLEKLIFMLRDIHIFWTNRYRFSNHLPVFYCQKYIFLNTTQNNT